MINARANFAAVALAQCHSEIHHAETKAKARASIKLFEEKDGIKYTPAVICLIKDEEALLAFYDFPAEQWDHLRTSNPIESVFATVRHRTVRMKGALSQKTAKNLEPYQPRKKSARAR